MIPKYSKVHNRFKLNGCHFNHEALKEVAYSYIKEGETHEKATGNFLLDWLNEKDYITVHTSGSTGQPKLIELKKQAMVHSAIATGNYFNFQPGDTALHCLPNTYIAGKMMLVRALILGLEIDMIEPTSQPIFKTDTSYDFCAMVPLQVENSISSINTIKTLIIGGSKVNRPLLDKLRSKTSRFYETYGMTETVTHVAVKQLDSIGYKGDENFNALTDIMFQVDERNCLVIDAPKLLSKTLITNDIVDLQSRTSFRLLGRYDNVINSGGVKLFPEQIEEKLQDIIKERFIIASEKDTRLGEKLILIVENPEDSIAQILSNIKGLKTLDKFEIPKKIYTLTKFLETASGKIQRFKTLKAVLD
jgi:O-succinylbenzoic acid--CoA ligase